MANVIAGSGLGLFNAQAGLSHDPLAGLAVGRTRVQDVRINAVTGNLVVQGADEQFAGLGAAFGVMRTYNSQGQQDGDNNDGWRFGHVGSVALEGMANTAGSLVLRTGGDGFVQRFRYDVASGLYLSTEGGNSHDTLRWTTTLIEVSRDGGVVREHYDVNSLKLSKLLDQDGFGSEFSYSQGRVSEVYVNSTQGQKRITLEYNVAGLLAGVVSYATATGTAFVRTRYEYDAYNRLSALNVDQSPEDGVIVDQNHYRVEYTYFGSSTLLDNITYREALGATTQQVRFGYTGNKLTRIEDAEGRALAIHYGSGVTQITDGLGQAWTYEYNAEGQVTRELSPSVAGVRQDVEYRYDGAGNLTTQLQAGVVQQTFVYDERGNLTRKQDSRGATIDYRYNAKNAVVRAVSYVDLDTDGAGSLQPTDAKVQHFVYDDAGHLRFSVSADGQVHEYRYSLGLVSSEWRYTQGFALGAYHAESSPSLATLEAFAAGVAIANRQRTDYGYDVFGRLQTTTRFTALDAQGNGVFDNTTEHTVVDYDAAGNVVSRQARTGGTLSTVALYGYDGVGRVVSEKGADGLTATIAYSNGQINQVSRDGVTISQQLDRSGRVLSETRSATGETSRVQRSLYDGAGRLVMQEDAAGGRDYVLYDAQGHLALTVDSTGAAVGYAYNNKGQLTQQTAYATRINTSGWVQNNSVVVSTVAAAGVATHTEDRTTTFTYDGSGQLLSKTSPVGVVERYSYDGRGLLIQVEQVAAGGQLSIQVRNFYSAAGALLAELDGEGYLTEHSYDGAGQRISTRRYVNATNASLRASGSLEALRPATDTKDQVTRWFFDALGRNVGSLDAKGYLTETSYDSRSRKVSQTRYARLANAGATLAEWRPQAHELDQTQRFTYNSQDQLTSTTDAGGTETRYFYDDKGFLSQTILAYGMPEQQATAVRYNGFGEKRAETSGQAAETAGSTGLTQATEYRYDQNGRVSQTIDAKGNISRIVYDSEGRITHRISALGDVSEYSYNSFGELIQTRQYANRVDAASFTPTALVPNNTRDRITNHSYNKAGQLSTTTDAEGFKTTRVYDALARLWQVKTEQSSGVNSVVEYGYDNRGLQTLLKTSSGTTRQSYDAFGQITLTTDAMGYQTRTLVENHGRSIVVVAADGSRRVTEYDAFARVISETDALGNKTLYQFDASTRNVTTQYADGSKVTRKFNRTGQVIALVDALGAQTSYQYDKKGQLISTTDALGHKTSSNYDVLGLVFEQTSALGTVTRYQYDALGRVLAKTEDANGLALTSRLEYDAMGDVVRSIAPDGVVTEQRYDRKGQTLEIIKDANGLRQTTRYEYDGQGHVISLSQGDSKNPQAAVTRFVYDELGRVRFTIDAENYVTEQKYNANGQVVESKRYAKKLNETDTSLGPTGMFSFSAAAMANSLNTEIAGSSVKKVSGVHGSWDASATGNGNIASNIITGGEGSVSFSIASASVLLMAGLRSGGNESNGFWDIDYAIYINGSSIKIYEDGAYKADIKQSHQAGNQYRVWLSEGKAYYQVKSLQQTDFETVYISEVAVNPSNVYLADTSLFYLNDQINDMKIGQKVAVAATSTRYIYDALGRVRFTIDAENYVTEQKYNANGQVVESKRYAKKLNETDTSLGPTGMFSFSAAAMANSLNTEIAGSSVKKVSGVHGSWDASATGNGNIASNIITGGEGSVSFSIASASVLLMAGLRSGGNESNGFWDIDYAIYINGSSIKIYEDGAYKADIKQSHQAGNQYRVWLSEGKAYYQVKSLQQTDFETVYISEVAVNPSNVYLADTSLFYLNDQINDMKIGQKVAVAATSTRYIYDALGRVRFTIDAENYVTEQKYNANGQVVESKRYAKKLNETDTSLGPTGMFSFSAAAMANSLNTEIAGSSVKKVSGVHGSWDASATGNGNIASNIITGGEGSVSFSIASASVLLMAGLRSGGNESNGFWDIDYAIYINGSSIKIYEDGAYKADIKQSHQAGNQYRVWLSEGKAYYQVKSLQQTDFETVYISEVAVNPSNVYLADTSLFYLNDQINDMKIGQKVAVAATSTRYIYDALGRVRFTIDAENYVTEQKYNANGQVIESRRYPNKLKAGTSVDSLLSANQVINGTFERTATSGAPDGWSQYDWRASAVAGINHIDWTLQGVSGGENTFYLLQYGRDPEAAYQEVLQNHSVEAGKSYAFSAYTGAHRATVSVHIVWYDAQGNSLGSTVEDAASRNDEELHGGGTLNGYKRIVAKGLAPEGAVRAGVLLRKSNTKVGHSDSWLFAVRAQFEELSGNDAVSAWHDTVLISAGKPETTHFIYDALGRMVGQVDPAGSVRSFEYDAVGNKVKETVHAAKAAQGGAVKLKNTDSQWHAIYRVLGTFKKGDTVTATFRFKAPANLNGAMFLGDAGGPDPYDNSVYKEIAGNGDWQTIKQELTLSHDDEVSIYLYNLKSSTDGIIYDEVQISSTMKGLVLEEHFDGNHLGEMGWNQAVDVDFLSSVSETNWTSAQFADYLATRANTQLDRSTHYVYDALGRMVGQVDPAGSVRSFEYDAVGNRVKETVHAAKAAQGGAVKLKNTDSQWHAIYRVLGTFKKGDTVTATFRFKAPANLNGAIFLGDAGGPDPYDNSVYKEIAGNGDWQTIKQELTLSHDDEVSIYLYNLKSSTDGIIYDEVQISSTMKGLVLEEHFDGNQLGEMGWNQAVDVDFLSSVSETNWTPAQFTDYLATRANTQLDRSTHYVYDALGRMVGQVDPAGSVRSFEYDAVGNRVKETVHAAKAAQGGAVKLKNTDSQWHAIYRVLGTFKKGDTVTATFRFKAPANLNGAMFLGDAGGPDPYDNSVYKEIAGNGDWQTIKQELTLSHDDEVSIYLYNLKSSTDGIIYDEVQISSTMRGVVLEEHFDGNHLGEMGWNQAVDVDFLSSVSETNWTPAQFTDYLATRANTQLDRSTQYNYNAKGQLTDEYSPALTGESAVSSFANGKYELLTTSYGRKQYTYNAFGQMITLTEGVAQSIGGPFVGQTRTTKFEYDAVGRQTKVHQPTAKHAENTLTDITYDAFGNAVMNLVFDGFYSPIEAKFKVYNQQNQVLFDVEAELSAGYVTRGYVTEYQYDSFGNATKVTRYNQPIDLVASRGSNAYASALTESYVRNKLTPAYVNDIANRTIETSFDALGRKTKVQEGARTFSYLDDSGVLQSASARPETRFEYNSLGQVYRQSVVTGKPGETLDTYFWYDALGRQVKTLDANNYLTTLEYTAFGELKQRTEHARAVTSSFSAAQAPTAPNAGDNSTGLDRVTVFSYDALGRQVQQEQKHVQLSDAAATVSIITSQQYDAFGKVSATTNADGTTRYDYDALGNLIKTTSAATALVQEVKDLSALKGVESQLQTQSRISKLKYDIFGNVIESRQLAGSSNDDTKDIVQLFEYNERGQQVKLTMRSQLALNGESRSSDIITKYDAKGRVVETSKTTEVLTSATILSVQATVVIENKYASKIYDFSYYTIDLATGKVVIELPTDVAGQGPDEILSHQNFKNYTVKLQKLDGTVITVPLNVQSAETTATGVVLQRDALIQSAPVSETIIETFEYDALGRQTATSTRKEQGDKNAVTTMVDWVRHKAEFNSFGEITTKTIVQQGQADIVAGRYQYNRSGLLLRSSDADQVAKIVYTDLAGRTVAVEHAQTGTTKFALDKLGRQTTMFQATSNGVARTEQQFDRWGNVLSLTDVMGNNYRYQYNQFNQVVKEIKPRVLVVDAMGGKQLIAPESKFSYDQMGRKRTELDANGNVRFFHYNAVGDLDYQTDAVVSSGDLVRDETAANKTRYVYDSFGRKVAEQNAIKTISFSQLNAQGLVLASGLITAKADVSSGSIKSVWQQQQRFEYNSLGERIASIDGEGHRFNYQYDARGNVVLSKSATGLVKRYSYDGLGRKLLEGSNSTRGASGSSISQTWQYAANGSVTYSAIDKAGLITYSSTKQTKETTILDAAGNIASGRGGLVENVSNWMGLFTNIVQRFEYYDNGLLKSVTDASNNVSQYKYNAAGQRTEELHQTRGLKGELLYQRIETKYDSHGRVAQVWIYNAPTNGQLLSFVGYQYDAVGNRRSVSTASSLEGMMPSDFAVAASWGPTQQFQEGSVLNLTVKGNFPEGNYQAKLLSGDLPPGLTLDSSGRLAGTLPSNLVTGDSSAVLRYTFVVEVTDTNSGLSNYQELTLTVSNKLTPWVNAGRVLPTLNLNKRVAFSQSLEEFSRGPEQNRVQLRVISPSWMRYDANSMSLVGIAPQMGTFNYEIEIDDGVNGITRRTAVANVAATYTGPDNRAPITLINNAMAQQNRLKNTELVFDKKGNPIPPRLAAVSMSFDANEIFTDDNGDALTLSIAGLPAGLTLVKSSTVDGTWLITQIDPQAQITDFDKTLQLTASDGRGGSVTTQIRLLLTTQGAGGAEVMFKPIVLQSAAAVDDREPTEPPEPPEPPKNALATYWYTYDSNNRVTVDGGSLTSTGISIATQGNKLFYTSLGQLEYVVSATTLKGSRYVYNASGQLSTVQQLLNGSAATINSAIATANLAGWAWRNFSGFEYDSVGHVVKQISYYDGAQISIKPDFNPNMTYKFDMRGAVHHVQQSTYNADGELILVEEFGLGSNTLETFAKNRITELYNRHQLPEPSTVIDGSNLTQLFNVGTKEQDTSYFNVNEAGLMTGIVMKEYSPSNTITRNFTKTLELRDNWLEMRVIGTGRATSGSVSPGETVSVYDNNGNRVQVNEMNDIDKDSIAARRMIYSADGTLLQKLEGKTTTSTTIAQAMNGTGGFTQESASMHFTSGGNYLGEIGESKKKADGSKGDFINTLKASQFKLPELSAGTPTFRYQVRQGDTLKALALSFYGNADYWYLIANANGVASDPTMPLVAGLSIEIPPRGNVENNANSFKPMQVENIIGNTLPSLPYLPPPPKCNAIATIVMVAISVAVTMVAGPAGATMMQSAAAAMLGSFVSQVAGMAMGVVDSISLKSIAVSGITAGATNGLGELMGVGEELAGTFTEIAKEGAKATLNTYGKMAMAAANVGINVAANKLVGNNNVSFSWRNVVTSAAAAGISHGIGKITWGGGESNANWGERFDSFTEANQFEGVFAQNVGSAALNWGVQRGIYGSHFKDQHWNFKQVALDAFGNALGSSIGKKVQDIQQQRIKETEALSQKISQMDARYAPPLIGEGVRKTFEQIDQSVSDAVVDDFEGNLYVMTQESDQLADISREKNAAAALKYQGMSEQAKKDIAAIDQRSRESAQKRADDWDIWRARQQEKLIDFRMDNPVYRAPEGFSQFSSNVDSLIEFGKNQKIQLIEQLNLSPDAKDGSWNDVALWYGAALINESWQGGQFLGKSVINGLTLGFYNDEFSPLSSEYHSLIGENKLFGKPTTIAGAIGYEAGEVGSYLIDPLAAVGVVGKLSKFDLPSYVFVGQDVNSSFGQAGALINGKLVRTVPTDVSASFQGMKYLDPRTNTFQFGTFDETMAVDHIVPVKSIQKMPGFNKLTIKQQIAIIQDQVGIGNFQPLPKSLNSSKGSKSFDTAKQWNMYKDIKLDSVYVNNLHNTQEEIALAIRAKISEFQKLNNQGNK